MFSTCIKSFRIVPLSGKSAQPWGLILVLPIRVREIHVPKWWLDWWWCSSPWWFSSHERHFPKLVVFSEWFRYILGTTLRIMGSQLTNTKTGWFGDPKEHRVKPLLFVRSFMILRVGTVAYLSFAQITTLCVLNAFNVWILFGWMSFSRVMTGDMFHFFVLL